MDKCFNQHYCFSCLYWLVGYLLLLSICSIFFFAAFIDFNDIFYLLYLNKHFCHSPLRYVYQKFYLSLCLNFHSLKVILEWFDILNFSDTWLTIFLWLLIVSYTSLVKLFPKHAIILNVTLNRIALVI